jgi:fatty-acyl-CoA synthase
MKVHQQDWIAKWAIYSPEKIAIKEQESGKTLSYRALNDQANALAFYLTQELGLEKGDRIAILAENCLEYIVLFGAAQKTGCILVPLNYRLRSAELDYLIQDAQPKLIISETKFNPELQQASSYESVSEKLDLSDLSAFSTQKKSDFPINEVNEDDPIFILYTSGTTGFPKGAIYSHKMLFWNSINTALSLLVNTESRTINCMPPFHTGGWNVLVTPFLHHGAYTCLMKSFDAETTLQLLEDEQPSIFMGVPTMLKMMADVPGFEKTNLSSLEYIIVGGEPMPIPLIETWHKKHVPIRQGYGMTEVGPNLTSLHHDDAIRKKGSIGRPNFYVQIKIVNPDGQQLSSNQAGELLLKGPMVTPGYWNKPEATAKALDNGWFHTGDMAKQDEAGYLYIVDRIKNMYISGGENVYPAEVERVIIQHEKVSEVAIIPIPDSKWGEVGQAFIVAETALDESEIFDYCKERLAKFKIPKVLTFLDEIPKNNTGKIDRSALKNML